MAVAPIAAELGATKGSFYWHFSNRDALIEAALHEWELLLTDAVIEMLDHESDPSERIRKLFAAAAEMPPAQRAAEIAILANPDHPIVARAVRRVTQRRVAYMALQFEKLGWDTTEATDRAVLVACLYVGMLQVRHISPHLVTDSALKRELDLSFRALVIQN